MQERKVAVIAVGGNVLINNSNKNSMYDQAQVAKSTMEKVVCMIERGWKVILTHGNGPQVGFSLQRSEAAVPHLPAVPLDYAVAETQGSVGYILQHCLYNELRKKGLSNSVVSLITQSVVDANDPAFLQPNKPIGVFMTEQEAKEKEQMLGWSVMKDANRGWRRSVPSPKPIEIVGIEGIRRLVDSGAIVIACGGGGIPVTVDADGVMQGIEAVIDKDYASSILADQLQADLFLISTAVDKVAINFGEDDQQWLGNITVPELIKHQANNQFGAGSMAPKVEAVIDFLIKNPKAQALITSADKILDALDCQTGTWVKA